MTASASSSPDAPGRSGLIGRLRATVGELGLGTALLYWTARVLDRSGGLAALHRYVIVLQPVPEAPLLKPHRGRSITVREVAADEECLAALPLTRDVLDYRFGQGATCYGAFQDGALIGCLWLALGPFDEDEVRCRYLREPEGAASWDFDVYIDPAHRAGFAFGRLWDTANARLRAAGARWSASRISAFNRGSLRSHRALGARPVGTATFLRLGPAQVMASSLKPRLHVCLTRAGAPRLRIPCGPQERDRA